MNELNVSNYIYSLGHFWQSFNNLEFFLRRYLNIKDGMSIEHSNSFTSLPIGTTCDECAITDWKTFGELAASFNSHQKNADKIDFKEFADLRDALAHGRITGDDRSVMSVIKYSKPKNGQVLVEYSREISSEELEKMAKMIGELCMEISRRWGAKMP